MRSENLRVIFSAYTEKFTNREMVGWGLQVAKFKGTLFALVAGKGKPPTPIEIFVGTLWLSPTARFLLLNQCKVWKSSKKMEVPHCFF